MLSEDKEDICSIVSQQNVEKSSCISLQRKIQRLFRLFLFQNRVNRTRPKCSHRAVTVGIRQRAVDRLLGEPRYRSFSTTVKSFYFSGWGHTHSCMGRGSAPLPQKKLGNLDFLGRNRGLGKANS